VRARRARARQARARSACRGRWWACTCCSGCTATGCGDQPAVGFQPLRDLDAFVQPEAARHAVVHVQFGGDRELAADRVPHGPADVAGQARPAGEAPAVVVRAPVEPGTQERADQVVVPEVDLHRVEAGFPGNQRGLGVSLDDPAQVADRRGSDHPCPQRTQPPGGPERGQPVGYRVGDRARVAELGADGGALGVHGVGEPAQPRYRLRAHPDLVAVGAAFRGYRAVGHRRHADPAARGPQVEVDQSVGD